MLLYKAGETENEYIPFLTLKKTKGSILFLMATRIMYLTAAVFLALAIISTTEAGGGCKHSSFLFFVHYILGTCSYN